MSNRIRNTRLCAFFLGGSSLLACSSSHPVQYPYDPNTTNVIGGSGTNSGSGAAGSSAPTGTDQVGVSSVSTYTTPSGSGCLELDGSCVAPQNDCGEGGTADVIVGENGEVLSTICYPNRDYSVDVLPDSPVSHPPLGNNTVVVIDGKDDGVDIEGDLTIQGNNVIVYGAGPDTSVIGGNLAIDKNNAIVRGVRIQGNTTISKNNASLLDCVIEGDLTITGNNVNLALCEIWGKLDIQGENAVFVSNLVEGDQKVSGINLRCNDNHYFSDAGMDGSVDPGDVTGNVTCESRDQAVPDNPNLGK